MDEKTRAAVFKRIRESQRQNPGGLCPRCQETRLESDGENAVKSRYVDVLICRDCAINEVDMEIMHAPGLPGFDMFWRCFQPIKNPLDFKDMSMEDAETALNDGLMDVLTGIIADYYTGKVDWEDAQRIAYWEIPGLENLTCAGRGRKQRSGWCAFETAEGKLRVYFRIAGDELRWRMDRDYTAEPETDLEAEPLSEEEIDDELRRADGDEADD